MYNFFKNIFGIPSNDSGSRSGEPPTNDLRNDFRDPIWGSDDYEDDDEDFRSRHGGFGFPVDTDPIEIHKYFESMMDDMLKNFSMFGFNMRPGIEWDDEGHTNILPFNSIEDAPKNKDSLRDNYLKPGYSQGNSIKEDSDLDGKIDVNAVKSLLGDRMSDKENIAPVVPYSKPQVFSSQVYVRTIRRPDGSVETIRKVRDHTGKEETTVTRDFVDPNQPVNPSIGDDDPSNISIFKKFFSF